MHSNQPYNTEIMVSCQYFEKPTRLAGFLFGNISSSCYSDDHGLISRNFGIVFCFTSSFEQLVF